jgi:hypothetical protein
MFLCPYLLQFSPNFDKIQHVISTASNAERTWVSLESAKWKPYFVCGPLWFFCPYPLQFLSDFNKMWHMISTGGSIGQKWLSMKLVQWTRQQLCFFRIGAVEVILYLYLCLWSYTGFRPYSFCFLSDFEKILLLGFILIRYGIFVNCNWVDTWWQ